MMYLPRQNYTPEKQLEITANSSTRGTPVSKYLHPDYEIWQSISRYENGPETYLLQPRDVSFPLRLREYRKMAHQRSPSYVANEYLDWSLPIVRERRRFTDVMDEEIDEERSGRYLSMYSLNEIPARRLKSEIGVRLDEYTELDASLEVVGSLPFFREKPQTIPIIENQSFHIYCLPVGDPAPFVQWFQNDNLISQNRRVKISCDEDGRSILSFSPAMNCDIGVYKVVARNRVGKSVARCRIIAGKLPDPPCGLYVVDTSSSEILLKWKRPVYDGYCPILHYCLQYKRSDRDTWSTISDNITNEFYLKGGLKNDVKYEFRLSSRNIVGWSVMGDSITAKTKIDGQPITISDDIRRMHNLMDAEIGSPVSESRVRNDYHCERDPPPWITDHNFSDKYTFNSEIYRGSYSIVLTAIQNSSGTNVVVKVVPISDDTELCVIAEFENFRSLRHERIPALFAAYKPPERPMAIFVMEKLSGYDVLSYLSDTYTYSEEIVAIFIRQLLDALQYLHWRGICHLNIQPDNIVLSSLGSKDIKLIDFADAKRISKLGTKVQESGLLEFRSPEMINDELAYPQTDVWSVGVMTYLLLSGCSPFRGSDINETKSNISFVRYRFDQLFKGITIEATRFIMFLFKRQPTKRPYIEDCLEHRWLAQSDYIVKKREQALFMGNSLKAYLVEYRKEKKETILIDVPLGI